MNIKKFVCFGVCSIMLMSAAPHYGLSKDLLSAYFPEPFVNEMLAKCHVPKDQWETINMGTFHRRTMRWSRWWRRKR